MTKARSNATANAAKGDLTVGTGTNLSGVLSAGNNGEALVLDSSTATGLRWQGSIAAAKNFLINGGYDIWQRSTSYALTNTGGAYGAADRWSNSQDSTAAGTASQVTSSLPTGFRYAIKIQRTAGATTTGAMRNAQVIETANAIYLAGQTVTLSFWAKAGANYSPTSSTLNTILATGTGTDQSSAAMSSGTWTGYAGNSSSYTLTTSWQRFTYTVTLPSTITQAGITFYSVPTGTAGADDSYFITGVQLEIGSVATSFTRAGGTIQGELAACQRYYWRSTANANNNQIYAAGFAASTSAVVAPFDLPVQMRTVPTVVGYSNIYATDETNNFTPSSVFASSRASVNVLQIQASITGATAFRPYLIVGNGTAGGYIDASAEL